MPLDKEEVKLLRRQTGKINWAATQSRPDLAYDAVELSTKFKRGTLNDLKKTNRCHLKATKSPFFNKSQQLKMTGRFQKCPTDGPSNINRAGDGLRTSMPRRQPPPRYNVVVMLKEQHVKTKYLPMSTSCS